MPEAPTWYETPVIHKLPANASREIGRLIVKWAYFEYVVQMAIWALIGVDEKVGRLAVREARIEARLILLEDLASLKSCSVDAEIMEQLRKTSKVIERNRDLVAHGLWTKHPEHGKLMVQLTKGNLPRQSHQPKRKRAVVPEGVRADVADLQSNISNLDRMIEVMEKVVDEIREKLPASA